MRKEEQKLMKCLWCGGGRKPSFLSILFSFDQMFAYFKNINEAKGEKY